jgi:GxxExxY protein
MQSDIELIAKEIVDSSIKVHKAFGPGLLESAYQRCIIYELRKRGLKTESEINLPLEYDGIRIEAGYRIDLRVEDCIIVENKTVDLVLPIHEAQLLTYLKLSGCPIGLLLNWKVNLMRDGIRRLVWNLNEPQRARRK